MCDSAHNPFIAARLHDKMLAVVAAAAPSILRRWYVVVGLNRLRAHIRSSRSCCALKVGILLYSLGVKNRQYDHDGHATVDSFDRNRAEESSTAFGPRARRGK
jgi:hypothetical protein